MRKKTLIVLSLVIILSVLFWGKIEKNRYYAQEEEPTVFSVEQGINI